VEFLGQVRTTERSESNLSVERNTLALWGEGFTDDEGGILVSV